jgi:predicted nucleic acid-binding protein
VITADSSTWVALLQGEPGEDTRRLRDALEGGSAIMLPVVLTELLSGPQLAAADALALAALPLAELQDGYWQRAGRLRARVLALGRKARLGDALIAQSCLDDALPLLTRDRDFLAFTEVAPLRLVGAG